MWRVFERKGFVLLNIINYNSIIIIINNNDIYYYYVCSKNCFRKGGKMDIWIYVIIEFCDILEWDMLEWLIVRKELFEGFKWFNIGFMEWE